MQHTHPFWSEYHFLLADGLAINQQFVVHADTPDFVLDHEDFRAFFPFLLNSRMCLIMVVLPDPESP